MPQLGGNTRWRVTVPGKHASDSETRDARGVIRLVPGPRHDKHRPPRLHRRPGRADAAVVDDGGRAGEEFRVRGISKGYRLGAGGESIPHARPDEYRPIAKGPYRRQAC